MLAAARPRQRNRHRADVDRRCEPYLKWLRTRDCYVAGRGHHVCQGRVRACHVDHAGGKGTGLKVADQHALPMCDGAHAAQHAMGWASFEALHRFNAVQVSAELWHHWTTRTEMGVIWCRRQAGGEG